jgi:hypothetical protein
MYKRQALRSAEVMTATGNGTAVEGFGSKSRMQSSFTVASIGGTTPSFTGIVQGSFDGTNWFDLVTHTALTANGVDMKVVSEIQGTTVVVIPPMIRSRVVVSGTTPTGAVTHIVFAK